MYLNSAPITYLSLSIASGYLSYKAVKRAAPRLIQPILGSGHLEKRIRSTFKKIIAGDFSAMYLLFGEDAQRERAYSLLTGLFYAFSATTLLFLMYICYYGSRNLEPTSEEFIEPCVDQIDDYRKAFEKANSAYTYWTTSLCSFDQEQWPSTSGFFSISSHFDISKSCFDVSYLGYSALESKCNTFFTDMALESHSKDILPKREFEIRRKMALKNREEAENICGNYLFEEGHRVNKECNILSPYIGFPGEMICTLIQKIAYLGFSKTCENACEGYLRKYDIIHQKLNDEIPETNNIVLDCPEILDKHANFDADKEILDDIQKNEVLFKPRERQYLDAMVYHFKQNDWRNMTRLKTFEQKTSFESIEPWVKSYNETDPKRLEFLRMFFSIRRKVMEDLKAKKTFMDVLNQLKKELPASILSRLEHNKYKIIR